MTRYALKITRERVLELLIFEPKTGFFIWRVTRAKARAGCVAGHLATDGCRWIGLDGQIYHAHRLVWFITHGEWPPSDLDHKDLNRDHNWLDNLRLASSAQNQWNTTLQKNNTSGHKGVFSLRGKWSVSVQKSGVRHHIGYFANYGDACAAQEAAALRLHGEFSRT